MYLESRHLAANAINQQLAAVRRLAHGPADASYGSSSWLRKDSKTRKLAGNWGLVRTL